MPSLFTRSQIQSLLLTQGSNATVREFFNEEDGEEETLEVSMTYESLVARLKSLGARPISAKIFYSY